MRDHKIGEAFAAVFGPDAPASDPIMESVVAVCIGATEFLGDCYSAKDLDRAMRLVRRQLNNLTMFDDQHATAFRLFLIRRIMAHVPTDNPELVERILTGSGSPIHPYWLAVVPHDMLSVYCRDYMKPRPTVATVADQIRRGMRQAMDGDGTNVFRVDIPEDED